MIFTIQCSECSEIIGTVNKDALTDDDVAMWRLSVRCSQGHGASTENAADSPIILDEEE